MKSSKHQQGFFLLYELLCFVFTSMLLATTAHGFTASFQVQQRSLELQEACYMEVRVYAAGAKRLVCSLVTSVF